MKLFHIADLHIGKRVHEFSMTDEQAHILSQILGHIDTEQPRGIILAGDIYDKAVPSPAAVQLFDDFLYELSRRNIAVFIISGNHDSPERISFGSRIMQKSGIYLAPAYDGSITPITLSDEHGEVDVYLLPFIKPPHVRRYYNEEEISTYTDAARVVVKHMNVDPGRRSVLAAHQFVTGATLGGSEDMVVGGLDNVDGSVFDGFDYVALGHIHSSQRVGRDSMRYAGSPLAYSFAEAGQEKSVTVVDLGKKGECAVSFLPLTPKNKLVEIKGMYRDIACKSFYSACDPNDYYHITLCDEDDLPDALGELRKIYPRIMLFDYDNARTRHSPTLLAADNIDKKAPLELFSEFYEGQNGQPMTDEQSELIRSLIDEIWEGGK